ncbi:MAG: pyridoxamine 5'-phosphate oxidase family protein [Acidimicrobiales bacterium]
MVHLPGFHTTVADPAHRVAGGGNGSGNGRMVVVEKIVWGEVAELLAPARNYWLASVKPDGSPHATPIWGVVAGEAFFFYSQRSTVKAHNIAADPRVVVHLESGEEVLIVRGTAEDSGRPGDSPAVMAALQEKYDEAEDQAYLPTGDPAYDVLYRLRPSSARRWILSDFDDSQRAWSLGES